MFKAIFIEKGSPARLTELDDGQLPEGDVTVRVTHSTLNYKDALAITGRSPEVLVTGAAGGVGSVAIALLARRAYTVVASTGRPSEAAYLTGLGAARLVERAELAAPGKPLQAERWAG